MHSIDRTLHTVRRRENNMTHTPSKTVSKGIGKVQGCITRSGDILKVGKDFANAVSGQLKAHGQMKVGIGEKVLTWVSTMNCIESESLLREAVRQEGKCITYFESQGV
jgi:hypothetical protein